MKVFLTDLWHDLREKRLWPVAVVLALGLVAVPVMLAKPLTEPAVAPATPASQADKSLKGLAKVVLADDTGNGSKLNLFHSGDPFKPPKGAIPKAANAGDSGNGPLSQGTSSSAGTAIADAGSGGSGSGGVAVQTPSSGGGGGGTTGGTTKPKVKTTLYTYVIDLTYKHNGHTRKIKGMQKLEMLPDSSNPLLVFLGVDAKASNAVFLLDSSVQATGEGKCKPKPDQCSFLYLGAGSEELITGEDGSTYSIQIDEIRKVKVKPAAHKSSKSSKKSNSKKSAAGAKSDSFHATGSRPKPSRPFVPRLLLDLVSSAQSSSSKPAAHSR